METFFILFLIFATSQNPELKETLRSFLTFYRENRELIAMLTQNMASMPETQTSKHEESRPQSEVGMNTVLEEFLSKLK